jgi:hypothetical protein
MSQETADLYATHMMSLASQARGVIRDLNPKVKRALLLFFKYIKYMRC